MRRPQTFSVGCAHPGCDYRTRWQFSSIREYRESFEVQHYGVKRRPYYCVKHSPGRGVLTPDNLHSEWISEPSKPLDGYPDDPYRSFGGHGVLVGPGYYADGKAFPIGTRIKITAEVILPTSPTSKQNSARSKQEVM